jgi:AhpD family alkylhydroperoxidase
MRVPPRPPRDCPWYLRPFFWNQKRRYGEVLQAALVWARRPRLFLAVAFLYGMIDSRRSPVPPALRSLLTVRVSQINHCPFCVDIIARTLLRRGVPEEKLLALADWRTSPLFDEPERAALAFAEAMTESGAGVTDSIFEEVQRHVDEDAIVELAALIAFQNMSSKFNAALGVPPQGFCRLPVAGREGEAERRPA